MSEPPWEDPHGVPAGYLLWNGELVPRGSVPTDLSSGPPPPPPTAPPGRLDPRRRRLGAVLVVGVLVGILIAMTGRAAPGRLPAQEQGFLDAVHQAQEDVAKGNDLTVVTARTERELRICHLLARGRVHDWTGSIQSVGTSLGSDRGNLSVTLVDGVDLRTPSSLFGTSDGQIDPSSEPYAALARLHPGDRIRFSGVFVPSGRSCLTASNLFARNAMMTPDFVFEFTEVQDD